MGSVDVSLSYGTDRKIVLSDVNLKTDPNFAGDGDESGEEKTTKPKHSEILQATSAESKSPQEQSPHEPRAFPRKLKPMEELQERVSDL